LPKQQQSKKKCAKAGRSTNKCQSYLARSMRWKNKIKRIKRHIKRHPGDALAVASLDRVTRYVPGTKRNRV